MTLTELRYICALAQEQHFGRAAELCHVSQPTLSIALKKLEDELGVALFERAKARVLPTPIGMRIVAMAQGVLEQTAAIKDLADTDKDHLNGPLALGTLPTIGPYLLPQFIPLLQETASHLPLHVEEAHQGDLIAKLRAGDLDAILVTAPLQEPDIVAQPLFDEPLLMLLPPTHRLAHQGEIRPDDLDPSEVLLLAEGDNFRNLVLEAFPRLRARDGQDGKIRHNRVRSTTLETLRHMVATGVGVTILPQAAADLPMYASNLIVTRRFAEPVPKRTIVLAWRISFPRHKAIDLLRRAIQASSSVYWQYNTAKPRDEPGVLVDNRDW